MMPAEYAVMVYASSGETENGIFCGSRAHAWAMGERLQAENWRVLRLL
jgi:hypothetical protein